MVTSYDDFGVIVPPMSSAATDRPNIRKRSGTPRSAGRECPHICA